MGSLMRAHPKIDKVIGEPFNNKRMKGVKPIESYEVLRSAWDDILATEGPCDGTKVMRYNVKPWVFAEWMWEEHMPVVFLERRNLLKMVVSNLIATTLRAWNKSEYPDFYSGLELPELSTRDIRNDVRWRQKVDQEFKNALGDYPYYHVYYEDFYFNDGWVKILPKIFRHLGYKPVITRWMRKLMKTQRINDERTYLNIANVYEIEKECGDDETGWLFDGPPLMI